MSNEFLGLIEMLLGSSFIVPPVIEFVSHKVHGAKKTILMFCISLAVIFYFQWKEGILQSVNWKDIPSILVWAGALCTGMAVTWNNIWKKGLNPFLDKLQK